MERQRKKNNKKYKEKEKRNRTLNTPGRNGRDATLSDPPLIFWKHIKLLQKFPHPSALVRCR